MLRIARTRRSSMLQSLLALKSTTKQQQQRLTAAQQQLQGGAARLRKLQQERDATQAKLAAAEARRVEIEGKLSRAEALLPKLEERCSGLWLERKRLQDKVAALTAELAELQGKLKVCLRIQPLSVNWSAVQCRCRQLYCMVCIWLDARRVSGHVNPWKMSDRAPAHTIRFLLTLACCSTFTCTRSPSTHSALTPCSSCGCCNPALACSLRRAAGTQHKAKQMPLRNNWITFKRASQHMSSMSRSC
jgi:uncharacterized coiled-coil protein SlyX